MAFKHQHEEDCERLLGNPFPKVHDYLDALMDMYPPDKYFEHHRRFRHNSEGIAYCVEIWGEEAGKAAKIHIVRDWYGYHLRGYDLEEVLDMADKILKNVDKYPWPSIGDRVKIIV